MAEPTLKMHRSCLAARRAHVETHEVFCFIHLRFLLHQNLNLPEQTKATKTKKQNKTWHNETISEMTSVSLVPLCLINASAASAMYMIQRRCN